MEHVLIAYYSFEGHTEKAAEEIASRIRQSGGEADLLKIRVNKEPPHKGAGKFLVGGWMALTQKDPGILNENISLDGYDRIFLGMPVWAGTAPGAIAAFICKARPQGKEFYLFAVSGSGEDKKTLRRTTENLSGNRVVKTISLQEGMLKNGALSEVLDTFVAAPEASPAAPETTSAAPDDGATASAAADETAGQSVSNELLDDVQKYIDENFEDAYSAYVMGNDEALMADCCMALAKEEEEEADYSAPSGSAPPSGPAAPSGSAVPSGSAAPRETSYKQARESRPQHLFSIGGASHREGAPVPGHKPASVRESAANYASAAPMAFELDEGFSDLLFQLIDERGIKDADCYKKANVSKQVFSNIRSNPDYLPSKPTVLALAIALELDLDETKQLLERAGYAISHSSLSDVIVEYFIVHRRYDIFEINQVLFEHDQKVLGSR